MNSMTGYGAGDSTRNGFKVTVELSSVNRRQSEVAISLPRELEVLEAQIREEINRHVSRGRVTVRIAMSLMEGREGAGVQLNRPLAAAYAKELQRLIRELKLEGGLSLDHLIRSPGVLQGTNQWEEAEDFWPVVRQALKAALQGLSSMRSREGAHLRKDLQKRIRVMRQAVRRISTRSPRVLKRYRSQLMERIRQAGLNPAEIDEDRLAKELVLFADRSDVSEELTRLTSHFGQFDAYVESHEPVGRTLDFLAQEMFREINTIGSKANDAGISREVVLLKTELEKFREQVQNIE